jgi:hypothetical protein
MQPNIYWTKLHTLKYKFINKTLATSLDFNPYPANVDNMVTFYQC